MLMVTNGISMHAIKPLKELSTDKNIHIVLCQNDCKNLHMYLSFQNKVVRNRSIFSIHVKLRRNCVECVVLELKAPDIKFILFTE